VPQTPPFHSLIPSRKMTRDEIVRAIRLEVEAELDAVNLYHAHLEAIDDEDVRKVLAYVAGEEKEHAAIFLALLARLDPQQGRELGAADRKLALILDGASKDAIDSAGDDSPRH
jgi:rubrerythrin